MHLRDNISSNLAIDINELVPDIDAAVLVSGAFVTFAGSGNHCDESQVIEIYQKFCSAKKLPVPGVMEPIVPDPIYLRCLHSPVVALSLPVERALPIFAPRQKVHTPRR